jgi:HPr Serine kinase C-terminal domain
MMATDLNQHPQAFGAGKLLDWLVEARLDQGRDASSPTSQAIALEPVLTRQSPTSLALAFGEIASFRIDFAERSVSLASTHPDADPATIDHLLNDHVAPRIIAQLGALVIHGSAVMIGGRLAIFMGNTGAGKSTLAASLLKRGHQLLGDDAVVITRTDAGWVGESVYPSLRLFPESITQVFAESVDTDAMAFYSDKRLVRADALITAGPVDVPLGMIFVLTDGDEGVSHTTLGFADACMMIVENSFTLDPDDAVAAADRMAKAAGLAAAVPCHALSYPYDFAILGDVCRHVAALMEDGNQPPLSRESAA